MQRTNPDLFTVDPAKTRTLRAEADSIDWLNLDRVLPHHRVYLARRGVSAFVAKGRGYESAGNGTMRPERLPDTATGWTEEQRAHILGIAPVVPEPTAPKPVGRPRKDAAPAEPNKRSLMLPLFSLSARADLPVVWQARPDVAREIDGRPLKFEIPAGVKRGDREGELPVDVHPMLHARKSGGRRFDLATRPVFLTEGILKSDAVLSQSIREGVMLSPCAISGVTMGYVAPASAQNPFSLNTGTVPVLTDAMRNLTDWEDRVVYLCWDADWMTNPNVFEPLFTTARLLEAEGAIVRIVCVPTVKNDPKTGVDDYIAWALENEVANPLVKMLSGAISVEDAEWHVASYEEDDLGRGEHLAAYLSRNMSAVWNASRGSWMSYDEATGIWATDNAGTGILGVARDVFARDSQRSVRNMEAAIKVARTYPGVHRAENEFDQHPELMTVANGVVDLRTGELLDFDPALMLTQRSMFNFDPKMVASVEDGSADWSDYCPTWMTFLDTTFVGDADTIESIQRQLGERLYGAIRDHQMVWWYSDGRSGKGTITTVFHALLGTGAGGFTGVLEPGALVDPNGFAPWVRASLLGRRGIVVQELGAGAKLLEERIKKLTRGDLIQAEFKHGDAFDFQPTGKLIGVTNHLPEVFALDRGTWSSMKLVPFPLSLGEDEIDTTLGARLELEYPAILAWMVEGAMKYIEHGQFWSEYIETATREWALARDLVATTLACVEFVDDPNATVPFETVRSIYREIARTEGRSGSANKSAVAIFDDMKSHREMPKGVSLVNTSRRRQFRNARLTKEGEKLAALGGRSENY